VHTENKIRRLNGDQEPHSNGHTYKDGFYHHHPPHPTPSPFNKFPFRNVNLAKKRPQGAQSNREGGGEGGSKAGPRRRMPSGGV